MSSDVTLKPCPFCGGGDFVVEHEPWSWVYCDGCDANGPVTETEAEAIAAWNQRADAQDVAALVEALRRYADQFCELGPYTEACGKLEWDQCSGCLARTALAKEKQDAAV